MNPIQRAADLLITWSEQVDTTHAQPGAVESMRRLAAAVRAEYSRLQVSPGGAIDALIKAWAAHELDRLPRGPCGEWMRTGEIPPSLQGVLGGLLEPVASLVCEHIADEISECEICRRRAPCRLISHGTETGESDWRCAWGCPAPEDDPAEAAALREWAKEPAT